MKRLSSAAITTVLIAFSTSSSADTVTMYSSSHPLQSTVTLNVYLGGPPGIGLLIGSTGAAAVTGHAVIDLNLDATNSGTATLTAAEFLLASYGPTTIQIGALGTVDLSANNVLLTAVGSANVDHTDAFTIPGTVDTYSIVGGTAAISNPTGSLVSLLDGVQLNYDFGSEPIVNSFFQDFPVSLGTMDAGPGLFSPRAEFNFFGSAGGQLSGGGIVGFAEFVYDLHVAAVPEVSSYAIGGTLVTTVALWNFFLKRRRAAA